MYVRTAVTPDTKHLLTYMMWCLDHEPNHANPLSIPARTNHIQTAQANPSIPPSTTPPDTCLPLHSIYAHMYILYHTIYTIPKPQIPSLHPSNSFPPPPPLSIPPCIIPQHPPTNHPSLQFAPNLPLPT